ncbi:polyhydroxybutyrate depolymerase [Rhizobiaceae bacterium]|nr:polyhydroxybutyrate depolymerase [Rhizobiaceae bacterium]
MRNAILAALFACAATPALACGETSDCKLGERVYRIHMPAGGAENPGAIIYSHGYRGSAAGSMGNGAMRAVADRLGVALVTTQGANGTWDLPNAPRPGGAGEMAYFDALKAALVSKHGVDGDDLMITGFSAGGMVTWNVACERGKDYAAFAPIAGTFWAPVPDACPTLPVDMIHIHGLSDRTVPMKGRRIGNTAQGDVNVALDLLAREGGFGDWEDAGTRGRLTCQEKGNGEKFLQLCLHDGGHSIRAEWLEDTWRTFAERGVLKQPPPAG